MFRLGMQIRKTTRANEDRLRRKSIEAVRESKLGHEISSACVGVCERERMCARA